MWRRRVGGAARHNYELVMASYGRQSTVAVAASIDLVCGKGRRGRRKERGRGGIMLGWEEV